MKYIVRTEGKVLDYRQTAYTVNTQSREEAERIAEERFRKEYIVPDDSLRANAAGVRYQTWIALFALGAAAVLSLIGFKTGSGKNAAVIRPDLLSLLYGAAVYVILLMKARGAKNLLDLNEWKEAFASYESFALSALMIILIASIIQLMFSQMKVGFSFLSFHMDFRMIALALALIAYFGSGLLSLISLALFLILSRFSISALTGILSDVKGILFLVFASVGIIAYLGTSPAYHKGMMRLKALFHNPAKQLRKQADAERTQAAQTEE
ncbi:MAG: hypothetical protein E7194_00815 [Erysipelotrichaceae bacterium]|nr:hypothetical protein [Erysipelotrichaceae bacterium]